MSIDVEQLRKDRELLGAHPWQVEEDPRPDMEWNRHIIDFDFNRVCFMSHNGGEAPKRDEAKARRIARLPDLETAYLAALDRIAELEGALRDTRHEICTGPVDDVLWHTSVPACTTVDNITLTLGDYWSYDEWLERAALKRDAG